jgi:hypothetical protein
MSKPEGYVPLPDTTMNQLYSLALWLGPCPQLPDSLKDAHSAATFLDYTVVEVLYIKSRDDYKPVVILGVNIW